MGVIELPNNQYIVNKINNQNSWNFQIAVGANSHVSLSLDLDHYTVCDDKILIAVKTNGYVEE